MHFVFHAGVLPAQSKRPVSVNDCVSLRHIQKDSLRPTILVSPNGSKVAYLLRVPNIGQNRNDIELHVRGLAGSKAKDRLLISDPGLSSLRWMPDNIHLVARLSEGGKFVIGQVDSITGRRENLYSAPANISEFSITPDARTIAFALDDTQEDRTTNRGLLHTKSEDARGYLVPPDPSEKVGFSRRTLFIVRKTKDDMWGKARAIAIRSPLTGRTLTSLAYSDSLFLSLAPDGNELVFRYIDSSLERPKSWNTSPFVENGLVANGYPGTPLFVLYNARTGTASIPLATPFARGVATWSKDSRAFIVNAQSPVNSSWEHQDLASKRLFASQGEHLFWVDLKSGITERVTKGNNDQEQLLSWSAENSAIVRTAGNQVTHYQLRNGEWDESEKINIPLDALSPYSQMAATEDDIIFDRQSLNVPPELMSYRLGGVPEVLQEMNPQFDSLVLATSEEVKWKSKEGYELQGILFKPADYDSTKLYPLVISGIVYGTGFVCNDSGDLHMPSFAAQPLASAGILYLLRTYPSDWTLMNMQAEYPKGLPGLVGEPEFYTDVWDSAVASLDARHIIDPNKVGMIGWSRSGWETEYALVHSRTHYRAATVADNTDYGFTEYSIGRSEATMRGFDAMYGGPPFGKTLDNWEKYSISFNLDKVHTPLLMEKMGYRHQFEKISSPPLSLATKYELLEGLTHLKRPVELYYYPNEDHEPDDPQSIASSVQRNVDWYRFWLQGYERPNPEDPDQYRRWEHLRELQDAEDKAASQPTTAKPN